MAYLESRNVVHRDLAARNVLIHEDGTAKVVTLSHTVCWFDSVFYPDSIVL